MFSSSYTQIPVLNLVDVSKDRNGSRYINLLHLSMCGKDKTRDGKLWYALIGDSKDYDAEISFEEFCKRAGLTIKKG